MEKNKPKLFGTNGVRGIFGKDLTSELLIELCYSLATYFGNGPILIGYDGRKSSQILSRLVCSVLNSAGLDVGNAGLVPTPCLQYATKQLGYNGGIMITASHNPPEYNGLKAIAKDGVEISRDNELLVEGIYNSKEFFKINGFGNLIENETIIDYYINAILSLVDSEKIRSKKLTLTIDAGNGAQANVAPLLARKLGCKVIVINGNIDGDFPGRGPEPTKDNLQMLSNMVKCTLSDVGVAYDGDGDRSIFSDERGIIHGGDRIGALLVKHLLKTKRIKTDVVCPVNSSLMISALAREAGSKVIYTKVGSVEVSREMVRQGSLIGLEENGGFMYGKLNQVRDGTMTTALILDMLASSNQTLSELLSTLPKMIQFKTKFKCPTRQIAEDIVKVCLKHGSPLKTETYDGAKIWIDEESWLMVRPSGTEPLIRMYAESTDEDLLNSKVREYSELIRNELARLS